MRKRFEILGGAKPDSVVLGCTHYPFVSGAIRAVLGEDVTLFDPAPGIARQAKRRLAAAGLLNPQAGEGEIRWENSSTDPGMIELGKKLLLME